MTKIEVRFGGRQGATSWSLEESPALLAVRTVARKPVARVHFHSPRHRDLLSHPAVFTVRAAGVEVFDVDNQKLRNQFRASLPAEPEIEFAGRVLRTVDSRRPVLYTENLFLKFAEEAPEDVCRAVLEKHGLAIIRPLGFARNAYFVKAPEGTGLKVFTLPEQLFSENAVELCHPELVTEKSFRAAHPNQWHLKRSVMAGKRSTSTPRWRKPGPPAPARGSP